MLNIHMLHSLAERRFVNLFIECDVASVFFRYGMGMIFYKQEKFRLAEVHYRKALSINPHSSVLLCHVAVVSDHLLE